jgi:histidine ammonia-lyase
MGAFAARKMRMITKNLAWILAIELLSACQAIDLGGSVKLSSKTQKIYDKIRSISSRMEKDRSLHIDIEALARVLLSGQFLQDLKL